MKTSRFLSALLLSLPLLGINCVPIGEFDIQLDFECFLPSFRYAPILSDDKLLRASIACNSNSDCVNRRTLHQGAEVDFVIRIPESISTGPFEIISDPPGALDHSGFSNDPVECDDAREISGTVTFHTEGDVAFVVSGGGEELDRFTVDVQAPANLEVAQLRNGDRSILELDDTLQINSEIRLQAIVRGEEGDRLVAGPPAEWFIADSDLAELVQEDASQLVGATTHVVPLAEGKTEITVTVGELSRSILLDVFPKPAMGGAGGESGR